MNNSSYSASYFKTLSNESNRKSATDLNTQTKVKFQNYNIRNNFNDKTMNSGKVGKSPEKNHNYNFQIRESDQNEERFYRNDIKTKNNQINYNNNDGVIYSKSNKNAIRKNSGESSNATTYYSNNENLFYTKKNNIIHNCNNNNIEQDLESIFESCRNNTNNTNPNSINISNNLNNLGVNVTNSKAYINAMKALQNRIKSLEDEREENKELINIKNNEIQELKVKNSENKNLFQNLENKLKDKLKNLEHEYIEREQNFKIITKENEFLRSGAQKLEEKMNNSLKEYICDKNELKGVLQIKEDRITFLTTENQNLKNNLNSILEVKLQLELELSTANDKNKELGLQIEKINNKYEIDTENLLEKLKLSEDSFINALNEEKLEKEKIALKFDEMENYYKEILNALQNEKENLLSQFNEMKTELEIINTANNELKNEFSEKEKEIFLLQEKVDFLNKENQNIKDYSTYTKDVNEKLINNLIQDSSYNLSNIKQKKFNYELSHYEKNNNRDQNYDKIDHINGNNQDFSKYGKDFSEKKLRFERKSLEENRRTPHRQNISMYSLNYNKSEYQFEYEQTVQGIIELEKELVELIDKYQLISNKISVHKFFYK